MINTFWQTIKKNRDWLLIIMGTILILYAVFNLVTNNVDFMLSRLNLNEPVDQEGFAPIFVPQPSAEDLAAIEQPESPDIPERIIIDKIGLDAPVELAESAVVNVSGKEVLQYLVPEKYAVGWHEGSAPLGVVGNTVLSGHHNAYGEVFKYLIDVKVGDTMTLTSGGKQFEYVIANKMILPEKGRPIDVRLENGRWILPSKDERVTLVTCWPEDTNSHRLMLVAVPVEPGAEQADATTPTPTLQIARVSTPIASVLDAMSHTPTPTLIPIGTLEPASEEIVFPIRNSGNFSINIRSLPSMDGDILGSFLKNTDANATGRTEQADWLFITYGEIQGWVDAELIDAITSVEDLPVHNSDDLTTAE